MSDDADIASQIEAENLAVILANRPRNMSGISVVDCFECDTPIPQARRAALPGVQTCVQCAQLNEDTQKFKMGKF